MSKTPETQGKATHPMIALITGLVHQVNEALSQRKIPLAARYLLNLIVEINPEHQDDELRKKIAYLAHEKGKAQGRYLAAAENNCALYLKQVMAILWKYGYFTDEAYKFRDLTGGKPRR